MKAICLMPIYVIKNVISIHLIIRLPEYFAPKISDPKSIHHNIKKALLALPPAQGCANPCVRNFQIHEEDYFQPKEQKQ